MTRKRPTIADLRAIKGTRQLTMLRVMNLDEAEAAEKAGIDIVSIPPELMLNAAYRDAAPSLFSMPGDNFYEIGGPDDFLRWSFQMYKAGADAVYCSAGFDTVKKMADEAIDSTKKMASDASDAAEASANDAMDSAADDASAKMNDALKK